MSCLEASNFWGINEFQTLRAKFGALFASYMVAIVQSQFFLLLRICFFFVIMLLYDVCVMR